MQYVHKVIFWRFGFKNFCSGQRLNINYNERVPALFLPYLSGTQSAYAVLRVYCYLWHTCFYHTFYLLINMIFDKKLLKVKCVF